MDRYRKGDTMTEKLYETKYGTIHYWTNEIRAERRTLVFLPGLTADHRLFDKQITYFEEKYNCLVWDAPGHAASRPFRLEFGLDEKAGFLHEILKQENIIKPIMIGQSMGGYVAQVYMELYPGSLAGFVSVDSCPLKRKYVTAAEIWALRRTEPMYRAFPWKPLIKIGAEGCAESEYGRKLMKEMMAQYTKDEYCRLAGHGFRMLADAFAANRPYTIDCSAILICGTNDHAGSAKRYNKSWTREEGLPIYWIDGAGHNSNTDEPEEVNRIIEKFIGNIDS